MRTMPLAEQTARRRRSHSMHAGLSKDAARELSTSEPSAGAAAFGCSACNGLISTQAMSRRLLSTRRASSDMSFKV